MKKYIIVVSFIFLPCYMTQMYSMNEPCYLAMMPREIKHRIAHFLEWETEKDFIERVNKGKKVSLTNYCDLMHHDFDKPVFQQYCSVISYDGTKKAIINFLAEERPQAQLVISDIFNRKQMYKGVLSYALYEQVALSRSGKMLATVQKQERPSKELLSYHHNTLIVRKIVNDKISEMLNMTLPEDYEPKVIDFNKQETHVLVRGLTCKNGKLRKKCRMFSLNVIQYLDIGKENILEYYLRFHCVCKNMII